MRLAASFRFGIVAAGAVLALACTSKRSQLERVAKDWCLTIRASQILPVYPLSEDIQPGDIFLVQTPIKEQTKIYEDKGFLPLDQLVTRLHDLPYQDFYRDAYWKGTFKDVPHRRPVRELDAVPEGDAANAVQDPDWEGEAFFRVKAPRAAFPTYNFSVQRGTGLKLAIPISGVPVGLGIMGASRATGSVTISDAYTYGVDGETMVRRLLKWWAANADVRETLSEIIEATQEPIYLRVVTRVYLTGRVAVSLTNLDSRSVGVDVGAAPALELMDLSTEDATKAQASAKAYQNALKALAGKQNDVPGGAPGAAFRFTQASQRSVSMEETFDRPLVIGYLGIDFLVFKDGTLSPPIPSFANITGRSTTMSKGKFKQRHRLEPLGNEIHVLIDKLPDGKIEAARQAMIQEGLLGAGDPFPPEGQPDTPDGKRTYLKTLSIPDDSAGMPAKLEAFKKKLEELLQE